MESITLQPNNNKQRIRILTITAFLFLSIGLYHLLNATVILYESVEVVQIHDVDWGSLSNTDMPALEKKLEGILKEVRDGLPLTSEQMAKLHALYEQLSVRNGQTNGIVARLLILCEQILIQSGLMEVYLEQMQNGHQDGSENHDISGMAE